MTDPGVTQSAPDPASGPNSTTDPKLRKKRILACVLCQQRKVKCDRNFPCANCRRSGVRCLSTGSPQPRRRRFAERELLDRVQQYEELLRRNHVDFKPLHPPAIAGDEDVGILEHDGGDSVALTERVAFDCAATSGPIDFHHAIKKMTMEPDDGAVGMRDGEVDIQKNPQIRNSSEDVSKSNELSDDSWKYPSHADSLDANRWFLFGTPRVNLDLSSLHPEQPQILRLWQIYLENVDPLLKCTHSTTLQARIVDTLGHKTDTSPSLEALMFSIYCVSVMSLADDECLTRLGSPRQDLLEGYQDACQQALLKCKAWRGGEIDALLAMYLYLISLRPHSDPRSLSAMLAIVIRNAQSMGLHDEATNARFSILEAEMRRRLWWSLVAFDHRICELTEYKISTLTPVWDCRLPQNVNDFELRLEMKTAPVDHIRPTEAFFPFVRSELANSLRHSAFHLSFINPTLNALRRSSTADPEKDEVEVYEATIEQHLSFCEQDDPLSFMTTWTIRGQIARHHLLAYYAKHSRESMQQTPSQRSAALSHALNMLECETRIRNSPLTKRYLWLANFHVPVIAYFHIINHTKRHPDEPRKDQAWGVMRDNWNARAANRGGLRQGKEVLTFDGFVQSVGRGWKCFGAAMRRDMEDELLRNADLHGADMNDDSRMTGPRDSGGQAMAERSLINMWTDMDSTMSGQSVLGGEMAHFWTAMDWRFMDAQDW